MGASRNPLCPTFGTPIWDEMFFVQELLKIGLIFLFFFSFTKKLKMCAASICLQRWKFKLFWYHFPTFFSLSLNSFSFKFNFDLAGIRGEPITLRLKLDFHSTSFINKKKTFQITYLRMLNIKSSSIF